MNRLAMVNETLYAEHIASQQQLSRHHENHSVSSKTLMFFKQTILLHFWVFHETQQLSHRFKRKFINEIKTTNLMCKLILLPKCEITGKFNTVTPLHMICYCNQTQQSKKEKERGEREIWALQEITIHELQTGFDTARLMAAENNSRKLKKNSREKRMCV